MSELLSAATADAKKDLVVNLKEAQVEATELAYITATVKSENIFYAQQCKYTNKDLTDHNQAIHEYCKKNSGENGKILNPPDQVNVGDVFCIKYRQDNNWYRAQVKKCHQDRRECDVNFVDYGNLETEVGYEYLMRVSPRDLAAIERAPFGIYCTLENSDKLDSAHQSLVLDCLEGEYILFKTLERLDSQHWRVDVPKLAYNTQFWLAYERGKKKLRPDNVKEAHEETPAALARDANNS